jgi:hypothetical protein
LPARFAQILIEGLLVDCVRELAATLSAAGTHTRIVNDRLSTARISHVGLFG